MPLDKSRKEQVHHFPYFLPDGRHFLYRAGVTTAYARDEGNGVYVGSLDSSEYKLILKDDTYAVYASGHLLFWRDGSLMAQPFDERSLQLSGEPVPVAEQVQMNLAEIRASFSASENGVLVFQGLYGRRQGPIPARLVRPRRQGGGQAGRAVLRRAPASFTRRAAGRGQALRYAGREYRPLALRLRADPEDALPLRPGLRQ